jgi:hypothetical protein
MHSRLATLIALAVSFSACGENSAQSGQSREQIGGTQVLSSEEGVLLDEERDQRIPVLRLTFSGTERPTESLADLSLRPNRPGMREDLRHLGVYAYYFDVNESLGITNGVWYVCGKTEPLIPSQGLKVIGGVSLRPIVLRGEMIRICRRMLRNAGL